MKLYNSLSKEIEEFTPLVNDRATIYACGPTVYHYATIGNFRTYFTADIIVRTLTYLGYNPKYIMNITDVGHLTGEAIGDTSTGDDKLVIAATKENKTVYEIADYYYQAFRKDFDFLNLQRPEAWVRATEHIPEQIEMIKKLISIGHAYVISDGVYFNVDSFPHYGQLSNIDSVELHRVQNNPEKKNIKDFALWKISQENSGRLMQWESPWGVGFPGWHIECSAMSIKYLGEQIDIHVGGEDLMSTHHPNEIAQSEACTGKQFVKYWVHSKFLMVDGKKMSKSLGNVIRISDIIEKGFNPLSLRYLFMQTSYRKQANFTWESLAAVEAAYKKLITFVEKNDTYIDGVINQKYKTKFIECLKEDFNMSKALAVVWSLVKDQNISTSDKCRTLEDFDNVLGLKLFN